MTRPGQWRMTGVAIAAAVVASATAAITAAMLASSAVGGAPMLAATQLFLGATMLGLAAATASMLLRVPRGVRVVAQLVAGIEISTVLVIAAWVAVVRPPLS